MHIQSKTPVSDHRNCEDLVVAFRKRSLPRIKTPYSLSRRCPGTSFWQTIYYMRFRSNDMSSSMMAPKLIRIPLVA